MTHDQRSTRMLKPAIFFDRDHTLIINDGYLGDPARVVLMPHAADAVAKAQQMGFTVVTISNQSGVARGLFDESAVQAVDRKMDELLLADNADARIDLHLYCPYHPDAVILAYRKQSDLRKPSPGMILLAEKQLGLDLPRSWVVGDAIRDVECGIRAGCRSILFVPPDVAQSPEAMGDVLGGEVTRVSSLLDVMNWVERFGPITSKS